MTKIKNAEPSRELDRANVSSQIAHLMLQKSVELGDTTQLSQLDFSPRDYQMDAWADLWAARASGADRALMHLATGLGKTTVAVLDTLKFVDEFRNTHNRDPKVLFACHQVDILDQAADRFEYLAPNATRGYFVADEKNLDADVTFATFQSMYANLESLSQDQFDYIIYDEAHHTQADTFKQVVEHFQPSFQLALTATPERMDGQEISDLFGPPIYSKGLVEALSEGYLSNVKYHIVFDEAVKAAMGTGFEATSLKELKELMATEPRNTEIAENIHHEMQRIGLEDAKTIIFCEDIEHAESMAELLDGKAYHSGLNAAEKSASLDAFRNNGLKVICTVDMFNEGIDIPDSRLIVFLRSTQSRTIFEQQLGRGLRKTSTKDTVDVLDFVANIDRLKYIFEMREAAASLAEDDSLEATHEDGEYAGLTLHSKYADFDFDKLTVDIIKRLEELENPLSKLPDEQLIELALQISPDKRLETETINELSKQKEFVSLNVIYRRFGSLSAFQKACGFEVKESGRFAELSDEELIALALKLSPQKALTQNGIHALSKNEEFASLGQILKRFENIANFQKACGFEPARTKGLVGLSNEEIIALAMEISPDQPLTKRTIMKLSKEDRFVTAVTIIKNFNSIIDFQKACGFEIKEQIDSKAMTNEEIIALAMEISPDQPITESDISELSKKGIFISKSAIRSRFGSLSAFQKACGFEVKDSGLTNMSNAEIIALALDISPDKVLRYDEILRLSKDGKFVGTTTIKKRFGSQKEFHRACGFDV